MINSIPILYYHSVADHNKERPWSFLTCDITTFTKQMKYLYRHGYGTCDWDELYDHLQGIKQLPEKTVMIQFDDGFLDNWTVVFPLMKELNFKFTVVVTPEFIEKHEPRLFSNNTTESNMPEWWGYLSEEELVEMEASRLVDIQAHGYTHTWYPVSDEIVDIYDGKQIEPWLFWNDNIDEKPLWLTNDSLERIPLGYPIFKNEKSLSNIRAFKPSNEFIESCINGYDVSKSKEENLLVQNTLRDRFSASNILGKYESDDEAHKRLTKELLGTREYLERILGKKVEYLVWPGGGNNEKVQQLAFDCGYKLISKGTELNSYDSKLTKISRVAAYHEFSPKVLNPYLNVLFLQLQIWRANGNQNIDRMINTVKRLKKMLKK